MTVNIIGAGFAGAEASFFLAERGVKVNLYEMRDKKNTDAHKTPYFAELICSNSFKSKSLENAHGLLKKELEEMGSIIIKTAYKNSIPAGDSLAVDRDDFSRELTAIIKNHPNINFFNEEITSIEQLIGSRDVVILSTGPLTSGGLQENISELIGSSYLYFFDASAPVVNSETIDYSKVFFQSRYNKGNPDFINAPFSRDEYYNFVNELVNAEKVEPHDFEDKRIFSGCMPVEVMAKKGVETLAFGPMKPVGIIDPATGRMPYAVVQLRQENISKSMYNLVGFQTRLKLDEQKRIFRMIPGLEKAEFYRYGVMHKNIYLNFPELINPETYSLKNHENVYFAGQMTGVEGYIESAASGLYTAYAVWAKINNKEIFFPDNTIAGALQKYTKTKNRDYQPMAGNFGLINKEITGPKNRPLKGKDKKKILSEQALESIKEFIARNKI
jgi:methylenetetrahydrofolate--tRNA-(uracil-5-)-methyltransferase